MFSKLKLVSILLFTGALLQAAPPTVSILSPAPQQFPPTVNVGTVMTVTGVANDSDGDLVEHWLEVKRPAGDWSWQGWLTSEPFGGALNGSGSSSTKSGTVTLSDTGTYVFRVTAIDSANPWYVISTEVQVHVAVLGHISIQTTAYLTDGNAPNATGAHYSINDNGVVSASTTYVQNAGGDPFLTFRLYNHFAGLGWVSWTEVESHGAPSAANAYEIHRLKIARYMRATRSWSVTTIFEDRSGGVNMPYYSYVFLTTQGVQSASALQWRILRQTWNPGNAWNEYHTYNVPQQPIQ